LEIMPGPDGLLTREQAAALCGVHPDTISQWIRRGHLKVTRRQGRSPLLDPVEVAKAEHATAERARRFISPRAA
jgi:excisionase family DNA binding protein